MYTKFNTHFRDPRINLAPIDYEVSRGAGPGFQFMDEAQEPLHRRRKEKRTRRKLIESMENDTSAKTSAETSTDMTTTEVPQWARVPVDMAVVTLPTPPEPIRPELNGTQVVGAHTVSTLPSDAVIMLPPGKTSALAHEVTVVMPSGSTTTMPPRIDVEMKISDPAQVGDGQSHIDVEIKTSDPAQVGDSSSMTTVPIFRDMSSEVKTSDMTTTEVPEWARVPADMRVPDTSSEMKTTHSEADVPTTYEMTYGGPVPGETQRISLTPGNTVCINAPMPYVPPPSSSVVEGFSPEQGTLLNFMRREIEPVVDPVAEFLFPIPLYIMRVLKVLGVAAVAYLLYFGLRTILQFIPQSRMRRGGYHLPREYVQANFDESMNEPLSNDYVSYEAVGQDEVAPHPAWSEAPEQSLEETPETPQESGIFSMFGGMREEMIDQLVEDD